MKLESYKLLPLIRQRGLEHLWCKNKQVSSLIRGNRTIRASIWSKNCDGNRLLAKISSKTEPGLRLLSSSLRGFNDEKLETAKLEREGSSVQQVYTGPLSRMVKTIKVFSLATSAVGFAVQPLLIIKALPYGTVLTIFVGSFIGLYALLTPLLLHWVAKRYVVSLSFDPQSKTFTSTTLGLLLQKHCLQFSANEIRVPDTPGPLTSFLVKDRPLLVDPDHFTDPSVYAHLMGYDKPLDLHLDPVASHKKPPINEVVHEKLKET